MTVNGNSFVEWKEEFISLEREHRVVHYFLKDSIGESIHAVVGTERSARHMFYVVAEEFVRAYESPKHDWIEAVESLDDQVNEHCAHQSQNCLYRNLLGQTSEISVAWTCGKCGKKLKHYAAFSRNGTEITNNDTILRLCHGRRPESLPRLFGRHVRR